MAVHKDFLISGTPLRAVIRDGYACLCAYVGVPRSHWLADMEELEFPCHWGITFRGPGFEELDADWFWYGWDYAHAGDRLTLPKEVQALFEQLGQELPPIFRLDSKASKAWTVEEVEQEIWDVAMGLLQALADAQAAAADISSPALKKDL